MNSLELEMLVLLKKLKRDFAVVAVKAEFEAEAARIHEVMRLKEISERAGLGIIVKIGGAEAITDMFEAQHIGITELVAPMIETSYAMSKFLRAVKTHFLDDEHRNICFGVNIETYQAYQNFPKMLKDRNINLLKKVTLGRVDMIGSLGLTRWEINSEKIYKIAEEIFLIAKKKKLITAMGGGIDETAADFIKRLSSQKLLDFFETRKIVFKVPKRFSRLKEGIIAANRFELLWLQNKKNYYSKIYFEDDERIKMLKKRVALRH